MDTKTCRECRDTKPVSEFYQRGPNARPDIDCKKCRIAQSARRRIAYKAEVYARLGGKCFCCGETEVMFLGIDHKEGGGNKHRDELALTDSRSRLFMWLRRNPEEDHRFQLACHNCNFGRWVNGGTCPHQLVPSVADAG